MLDDQAVDLRVPRLLAAGAVLLLPQRPVTGDRRQPGPEPLRLLELGQRLERQDKGVLRQVVRLRGAHDLPGHGEHGGPEAAHQLVERLELAQRGGDRQVAIGNAAPVQVVHRAPHPRARSGKQLRLAAGRPIE